jgi:hypothetical protein
MKIIPNHFLELIKGISTKKLFWVLLLALLVRLTFIFFIAKHYFGRDFIFEDGDTGAWSTAITNLIEHGVYTCNAGHEYGYFGRTPGYAFFLGIFYWLFGPDWVKVFPIVGAFQVILDLISVYFIFRITEKLLKQHGIAIIAAGLYALYPFVVVWNPVCYSETLSVFLMLFSLYIYLLKQPQPQRLIISSFIIGLGCLVRLQLAMMFIVIVLMEVFFNFKKFSLKRQLFNLFLLFTGFSLTYGLWPARNYVNHGKLIFTQDLRGFPNWNVDVISFMQYIYSVKSEWDPQFTQIVKNQKVEWPRQSFLIKGDAVKLLRAENLARNNGSGFSHWKGHVGEIIPPGSSKDSSQIVSQLFNELRANQIKEFPVNFWVNLPLQNLNKALFKQKLYNNNTIFGKLSVVLFTYRTLMIFLGLIGLIYLRRMDQRISLIIIGFFTLLYFTLAFGTSPQMRNVEVRYFLPADILLLIPASVLIHKGWKRFFKAPAINPTH